MDNQDAPIDLASLTDQARKAQAASNWNDAVRDWEEVRKRAPDRPVAYLGLGDSLCELGRLDEADAVMGEGVQRFPDNFAISTKYAELGQRRGDYDSALRRWEDVRNRFPDRPGVLARLGTSLSAMGRFDQADQVLAEASARFPKNEAIAVAYAIAAQRRGDAAEALKRWTAVRDRHPEQASAQAGIELAERELSAQEKQGAPETDRSAADKPAAVSQPADKPLAAQAPADNLSATKAAVPAPVDQPSIDQAPADKPSADKVPPGISVTPPAAASPPPIPAEKARIERKIPTMPAGYAAAAGEAAAVNLDGPKAAGGEKVPPMGEALGRRAVPSPTPPKRLESIGRPKTAQLTRRGPAPPAPGLVQRIMRAMGNLFGRNASR